jgi:hypothetical protein
LSATKRAKISGPEPGGCDKIHLIGRAGQACAKATPCVPAVNAAAADNKALLNDLLCMLVSCFIFKKYDTILNLSLLKAPT